MKRSIKWPLIFLSALASGALIVWLFYSLSIWAFAHGYVINPFFVLVGMWVVFSTLWLARCGAQTDRAEEASKESK